ncbi:S26 family signal peptidase [Sphingobium sp. Cam5-1]|uniref:S26 family signal peptidase n=1 Tax=Sphingobium sp. Cam5-1 TaxID=2789327 RepID=UPI001E4DEB48|nr:S26 family signal peptidase [Sphingobium sp. Cam5-1]
MTRARKVGGDAPLLAWGDELRAKKLHRKRRVRRFALGGAGSALLLVSAAFPPAPRLVWNASASAPRGLYIVSPAALPGVGDMVIARVPWRYRQLAAERRYLPLNVPLVKRVAASAGDEVCAWGMVILVNGRRIADRQRTDLRGRSMPLWEGCMRLRGRQLFLLMNNRRSFDGRYFGSTEGEDVMGKAELLWRR